MERPPLFRFLTVVGARGAGTRWREGVTAAWADGGLVLKGEQLWLGDALVALVSLREPADVAERVGVEPGTAWLGSDPCPWTGPPVGVVSWEPLDDSLVLDTLVPGLAVTGRGPFVRLEDAVEVRRSMVRRHVPLHDLVSKWGFGDGDDFLREDDEYLASVRRSLEGAVRAEGFDAPVGVRSSHHNPVRLAGPLTHDGVEVADPEEALRGLSAELWVRNRDLVDDDAFWF